LQKVGPSLPALTIASIIFCSTSFAFQLLSGETAEPPPADTTRADSVERMSLPSLVGTLDRAMNGKPYVLGREDILWLDHRYPGDVLQTVPGVFITDQYSTGQYNQLNIRGTDWRGIAFLSNGRLLNDPTFGVFNPYHFAIEDADRLEVVSGPRAFLYGLNSAGGAINIVTKNYNSNRAFSKIYYSESSYRYGILDGTFSQNVSRKVNFTFGFQHVSTDGRFENSDHEAWNMRTKLRYNVSREFTVILSHYLTHTQTGLNGGIDYQSSGPVRSFDPRLANVVNSDSYEKTSRNDVDLSFVGTFLEDTTNVTTLSFYYSNSFRQYRDEENRQSPNGLYIRSDHTSSWMGAVFTQDIHTDLQRFDLGGNFELRQIEGSPNLGRWRNSIGSVWAKEELLFASRATLAAYGRFDRYLNDSYVGLGTDATVTIASWLSLFGGASLSRRLPNYQELYWGDSTVMRTATIGPEKHVHFEAGLSFTPGNHSTIRLAYFRRQVDDAITTSELPGTFVFPGVLFTNADRIVSQGIEAGISARIWFLHIEGAGTYLVQKSGGTELSEIPKVSGNGGIFFWHKLVKDYLDLKVGVRGRYASSYFGRRFNAEVLAYVPNVGPKLTAGSSVDFLLIAHIGDAYIHLMWENLGGMNYFGSPFNPILDRTVRFGISWEFLN
jgi:outer membrane cobalamin receptor